MAKPYRLAALLLLCALFGANVYRAFTQGVVHDEALTWELFLKQPWSLMFQTYDANNHVLNTVLEKLTTEIFGLSAWSLRLPSVLGGALYFWAVFELCALLFGEGWLFPLAVSALSLNPFVLDFLSAARGYGMAIAFLFVALLEMARWLRLPEHAREAKPLWRAGVAMALAVIANLTLAFATGAAAAALVLAAALFAEPVRVEDRPAKGRADKRKKKPEARRGAGFVLRHMVAPAAGLTSVVMIFPLSSASRQDFYVGASSVGAAVEGLMRSSFEYGSPPRVSAQWTTLQGAALVLIVSVMVAGIAIARKRRLPFLFVVAGTLAGAFCAVLASHWALGFPFPGDRTGLYWIPLFTLACLMLVDMAGRWRLVAAIPVMAAVAVYASEFNVAYYREWRYDAATRDLLAQIRDRHRKTPEQPEIIGASWQLEPALNFYREAWGLAWLSEVERQRPAPGSTFYLLLPQDAGVAVGMNLKVLTTAKDSGVVLAVPPE